MDIILPHVSFSLYKPEKSTETVLQLHMTLLRPYLSPVFTLVSFSAYCLALKMEVICFSETSVDFQRTTQHYIPKDRTCFKRKPAWLVILRGQGQCESTLSLCFLNNLTLYYVILWLYLLFLCDH
jgi:hypothetical protein